MSDINGLENNEQCKIQHQKLNSNQDEELHAYGYKKSYVKTFFTYFFYVLTIGCLRLFFHWYPNIHLHATYKRCALSEATKILIIDDYQGKYKSYFVKSIRIITTKNLNLENLSSFTILANQELVNKLKGCYLNINLENGTKTKVSEYKSFWCKKQCYVWDTTKYEFSKLTGLDKHIYCSELNAEKNYGLSREEQILRRFIYGNNEILVPVQSIGLLLILEILNPFYIFQIFTLAVWIPEGYIYYSIAIVAMSVFGIGSSIMQIRKNQISLRNTVTSIETVKVLRKSGEFESISSAELVPGDIIELPKHRGLIVCDAVLLSGTCIINESMLTGESIPVTKTSLPSHLKFYDAKDMSHYTLFCGTSIIQSKNYGGKPVLAKVIRTGFQTNKGSLVAAILYPPPTDFKFDQDSYKFIAILSVIALGGLIYTLIIKISRKLSAFDIITEALDIITIVVPPALPAVMTVGKLYAQSRLKNKQIFCINARAINVAGSINSICFDKTGTLTEDGLDMMGVVMNENNYLGEPENGSERLKNHKIFEGMLVCHSLTIIDDEVAGDPLDVKMFESTGWILEEPEIDAARQSELQPMAVIKPPKNNFKFISSQNELSEIEIVQQYQFSSTLQRMSVIAYIPKYNKFRAYTKGSPEMISNLSNPNSVPRDFSNTLYKYTEQGYRVIAVGYSEIDVKNDCEIQSLARENIEKDLEFLGLIILENRLKTPTVKVIKELRDADIRTIMITGDNILTAVSVAKECGILSLNETVINVTVKLNEGEPSLLFTLQGDTLNKEIQNSTTLESVENGLEFDYRFIITGETWKLLREHYFSLLPKICVKGAVFARMTSDQKQQLVIELMQLGYYVGMCGDGANDCGALRAAHVGISLSDAESSVASPFTSRVPDIRCVPTVIQQGRAALVTSFGIFKFMINYSLTEFVSTLIHYYIDANLTDLEFLFIDVCLATNFAFFFGMTHAYTGKLAKKPPMMSLISFAPLFSLAIHMLIIIIVQLTVFFTVQFQPWFTPYVKTDDHNYSCYENYSVFCISIFQYITLAIIFSRGKPYRKSIYTNYTFVLSLISMLIICTYITLDPAQWITKLLQLKMPPMMNWRLTILEIACINFILCFCIEYFLIEWLIEQRMKPRFYKPEKSKKLYLKLEHELKMDRSWPPISKELPALPFTPSAINIINSNRRISTIDNHSTNEFSEKSKSNEAKKNFDDKNIEKSGFDNLAFVND